MRESSSNYSRPKLKGYYQVTYRGIDSVPPGYTAHEYMRICNCLHKVQVLRRNWLSTMLRRHVDVREFDLLVKHLQRDGRLHGYEPLPSSRVTRRRRRIAP